MDLTGVAESWRKLAATAEELNRLSDKLSKSIRIIEESIAATGVGIEGWIIIKTLPHQELHLGYARRKHGWGLCIMQRDFPSDEVIVWSFNDAPRHHRIAAVDHVEKLINQLTIDARVMTQFLETRLSVLAVNSPEGQKR